MFTCQRLQNKGGPPRPVGDGPSSSGPPSTQFLPVMTPEPHVQQTGRKRVDQILKSPPSVRFIHLTLSIRTVAATEIPSRQGLLFY